MKKIGSACLFLLLLGIMLTSAGCTKSVGAADTTPEIKTEFVIGGETIKLEPLSLLSDKVSLLIPESFRVMTEEEADSKYPVERRPTVIYTDDSGAVNIALSYTKDKASEKELDFLLETLKLTFKNMYPTAEWYDTGVTVINGKKAGFMELLTPAADTEIYNLMWFTELDGILLISAFNCTKEQMEDWKPVAKTIMYSQKYFNNSNIIETPASDSREFIIKDYSIQVTCPAGWWQTESDSFDLQCMYQVNDLALCVSCNPESHFSEMSKQDYFNAINQAIQESFTNVVLLNEAPERQYVDKTIASVLFSGDDEETTIYYYSNLVCMKDSDCTMLVLFIGLPSDFEAGTETYDAILKGIKTIES